MELSLIIIALDWNPAREDVFASCDHSGRVNICHVNADKPLSIMQHAQGTEVWELSWNHMGTMLASCGGDRMVDLYTSKNWTPN